MPKPQLFLLRPGYGLNQGFFCPDCALIEGFFTYHPTLKAEVDFVYIDFERPRAALVTLLGAELQNSPALVFAQGEQPNKAQRSAQTGRAYLNDGRAICHWFGERFGAKVPS